MKKQIIYEEGNISLATAIILTISRPSILVDFASGSLSQYIGSRRKVVLYFLLSAMALTVAYLFTPAMAPWWYYTICFLLGCASGYWAVFVTIGAEQFGTNIRATVTTTVPNFVRGSVVGITALFAYLKQTMGLAEAAGLVGAICFALALLALWRLTETFGKDLNYHEE